MSSVFTDKVYNIKLFFWIPTRTTTGSQASSYLEYLGRSPLTWVEIHVIHNMQGALSISRPSARQMPWLNKQIAWLRLRHKELKYLLRVTSVHIFKRSNLVPLRCLNVQGNPDAAEVDQSPRMVMTWYSETTKSSLAVCFAEPPIGTSGLNMSPLCHHFWFRQL